MNRKSKVFCIAAVCILLGLSSRSTLADTTHWVHDPANQGDWLVASNWDNGLPSSYPIYVDAFVNNGGTAVLGGGASRPMSIYAGWEGDGNIIQTGGSMYTPWLELGSSYGSTGTYTLSDGTFEGSTEWIGRYGGVGIFIQNGGTHATEYGLIQLGRNGGDGTYRLNGGYFNSSVAVGDNVSSGHGTFIQTGGTLNSGDRVLILGGGSYDFQGGTLNCYGYDGNTLEVLENGQMAQSGGVNIVEQSMYVAGSYRLLDGTISVAKRLLVGAGAFEAAGGRFTVDTIQLGYSGGQPSLLNVSSPSADIEITDSLYVHSQGRIIANPGAALRMIGASFRNETTSAAALEGLQNLAMIFQTEELATYEAASHDDGPVAAGFDDNFGLGKLQIGNGTDPGMLKLVNDFQNQTGMTGPEAVYVDDLLLTSGSYLNLNGLKLYYRHFEDQGGIIDLNGGELVAIPEPATLSLLALGGLAMLRQRK